MKNLGTWCALAFLGVLLSREFLNWVWWVNWEDEETQNPVPLLSATYRVWCKLREAHLWLSSRSPQRWLTEVWWQASPPEQSPEPQDQDGRTPTEWLLISVIGIWEMESLYKGEYDWQVKRNWDDFLKWREAIKAPEADEERSANSAH